MIRARSLINREYATLFPCIKFQSSQPLYYTSENPNSLIHKVMTPRKEGRRDAQETTLQCFVEFGGVSGVFWSYLTKLNPHPN
jgi:hypothetical protein